MLELADISYSREATIAAVRDYLHFLAQLYLPESCIVEPPAQGWPSITSQSLQVLDKTDEVISLLRHLPYIKDPEVGPRAEALPNCYWGDWQTQAERTIASGRDREGLKIISEGYPRCEDVPAHVIGLTTGRFDKTTFLLDTMLGIVYWISCPSEIEADPVRERVFHDPMDYAPSNEEEWRNEGTAWAVADFFDVLKDQFLKLNFIPTSVWTVVEKWDIQHVEGMEDVLQEIYREHGWPDLGAYRKKECMEAIQRVMEHQYPDYAY